MKWPHRGRHVITLTVTDSDGLVGQARVEIDVCSDTTECAPGLLCPCAGGTVPAAPVPTTSHFGLLIACVILIAVGALALARQRL